MSRFADTTERRRVKWEGDYGRALSRSKVCVSCEARFWPPRKVPLADFCNDCWANVEEGSCPKYGCGGDATLVPADPIKTVQCDGRDFLVAHPLPGGNLGESREPEFGEPGLRTICKTGNHSACWKPGCTCQCHKNGGGA